MSESTNLPGGSQPPALRGLGASVLAVLAVLGVVGLLFIMFGRPPGAPSDQSSPVPSSPPAVTSPSVPDSPLPNAAPSVSEPAPTTTPPSKENSTSAVTPPPRPSPPPFPRELAVLNNSRVKELAAQVAPRFEAKGWRVTQVGNFNQSQIPVTTVFYSSGRKAQAQQLQEQFPGIRDVRPRFAGLPDDQLTVILTRDYVQSRGARASRTHQFLGKELLGK